MDENVDVGFRYDLCLAFQIRIPVCPAIGPGRWSPTNPEKHDRKKPLFIHRHPLARPAGRGPDRRFHPVRAGRGGYRPAGAARPSISTVYQL